MTPEDIEKGEAICAALPTGEPNVDGYAIMEFVNEDMPERLTEAGEDRYPNDSDAMESAFFFGWNQCADAHKPARETLPAALAHIRQQDAALYEMTLGADKCREERNEALHALAEKDAEIERLRALVDEDERCDRSDCALRGCVSPHNCPEGGSR